MSKIMNILKEYIKRIYKKVVWKAYSTTYAY